MQTRDDQLPRVSLVIAAHDEAEVIGERLAGCDELDYPRDRLEVIVADDGSTDETGEIAAAHPGVRVVRGPERRGKVAALNLGASVAQGDVILFSDANNQFVPGTVRAVVAPFADPRVGAVAGRKVIDDGTGRPLDRVENGYWRYESMILRLEAAVGSVTGVTGECLAVRRDLYRDMPVGIVNDDQFLAARTALDGWRVAYAPEAMSIEHASATTRDESVRRGRIVRGRYQALGRLLPALVLRRPGYAFQLVSHKGLRLLVPWAVVTGVVATVALAVTTTSPVPRVLLALGAAFVVTAAAGWHADRVRQARHWTWLPYYLCRVAVAGMAGSVQALSRSNGALWAKVPRG